MKAPAWRVALALALVAAAAAPPAAQAWVGQTPDTHHGTLAVLAAQRLPEPQRALVMEHREAFERGAWEPDAHVHTFWHTYSVEDGGGGALYELEKAVYDAAMAMRRGDPPEDVAYRLGYLTHFSMDLAVPFHTAEGGYDHEMHLKYELSAQLFHDEMDLNATRAPQEVEDVRAAALALARESARHGPALVAELESTGLAWTPLARNITEEVLRAGLETTADLLLTAIARGDPSRPAPEPTHLAHEPVVRDLEEVGLGPGDARRALSWALLAGIVVAAGIVAAVAVFIVGRSRRRGRKLRRA